MVRHYDAISGTFSESMDQSRRDDGGFYASVSGQSESADCVLVGESFLRAPEIAVIRQGTYRAVKSFDLNRANYAMAIETQRVSWRASDGLEIPGVICSAPKATAPFRSS